MSTQEGSMKSNFKVHIFYISLKLRGIILHVSHDIITLLTKLRTSRKGQSNPMFTNENSVRHQISFDHYSTPQDYLNLNIPSIHL